MTALENAGASDQKHGGVAVADENENRDTPADEVMIDQDRPGDLLRKRREELGLSLAEIAERTRVPTRQLSAIEANDFSAIPAVTYAVGFVRSYARAVDLDPEFLAARVREEMGAVRPTERYDAFEPIDPSRVPPRWIAIAAAVFALLLIVGYGIWRAQMNAAPADEEIAKEASQPVARQAASPAVAPQLVVLTATTDVWLRITDQSGARLFEGQMKAGDSFTVPEGAANPTITTGRADALAVTVGGKSVGALGPADKTLVDEPLNAAALIARPLAGAGPEDATNATAPVAAAGSSPATRPAHAPAPARRPSASRPAPAAPTLEPAPAPAPTPVPVTATPAAPQP